MNTQKERKSLTHRLDLGGVATPRPRKSNGSRRKAQKQQEDGHKRTEPRAKNSHNVHENKESDMGQTAVEEQVAATAEQLISGGLKEFKGLDVKVRVQKNGADWGKVGETAAYAGIAVVGGTLLVGGGLLAARVAGFGPDNGSTLEP